MISPHFAPSQRSVLNFIKTSVGTTRLQRRFSSRFSGLVLTEGTGKSMRKACRQERDASNQFCDRLRSPARERRDDERTDVPALPRRATIAGDTSAFHDPQISAIFAGQ